MWDLIISNKTFKVAVLFPTEREGNWGIEKSAEAPRQQRINGRAGIQTLKRMDFKVHASSK